MPSKIIGRTVSPQVRRATMSQNFVGPGVGAPQFWSRSHHGTARGLCARHVVSLDHSFFLCWRYVLEVKSICLSPRPLGLFFPHVLSFRNVAWHVVGSWVLSSLKTRPVGSEARSGPNYLCHLPSRSAGGRDPPPVLRSCSESVSQTLSLPRNLLGPPARGYKPLLSFIVTFV